MKFSIWNEKVSWSFMVDHKIKTSEDYERVMNELHKQPEFSVENFNAAMNTLSPTAKEAISELNVLSEDERKERFSLSAKVRQAYVNKTADYKESLSSAVSTGLSYPELMMVNWKDKSNYGIQDVLKYFKDLDMNADNLLNAHIKMLTDIDKYAAFVQEPHTDEELVDNAELIINGEIICSNLSVMTGIINDLEIDTPELKQKFAKFNSLAEKFRKISDAMIVCSDRLGFIESPMYAVLDSDDIGIRKLSNQIENEDSEISEWIKNNNFYSEKDEYGYSYFETYIKDLDRFRNNNVVNELKAMKTLLSYDGSACTIKVGNLTEEFTDVFAAYEAIKNNPGAKVTVSNPQTEESLELRDFDKPYYAGKVISSENMTFAKEELPEEVKEPSTVVPPEPGFFKKALYYLSGKRFFKKSVEDYREKKAQYDEEVKNHEDYVNEKERINLIGKLQKEHLRKLDPNHNKDIGDEVTSKLEYNSNIKKNNGLEHGISNIRNIYGAVREKNVTLLNSHVYDHETFRMMKGNDIDLNEVTPVGISLDNDTFAAMATVSVCGEEFDSKRSKSLANTLGFEDIAMSNNNFNPRAAMQNYIKDIVEPARDALKKGLQYFKETIPGSEPPITGRDRLIDVLGNGLKDTIKRVSAMTLDSPTNAINIDTVSKVIRFADQAGILENIAAKYFKNNELESFKVSEKCSEIIKERYDAELKLIKNSFGDLELSEAEKRDLIDNMALGKTLVAVASAEYVRLGDERNAKLAEMMNNERREGESNEDYALRMADNIRRVNEFQSSEEGRLKSLQTDVIKDLVNGGDMLNNLSNMLMSTEERETLAKKSAKEISKTISTNAFLDRYKEKNAGQKTLGDLKSKNNENVYDDIKKNAFEVINNPNAKIDEMRHAVAEIVTANIMITAKKFTDNDIRLFDRTVGVIESGPDFKIMAGNQKDIRQDFKDEESSLKATKSITPQLMGRINRKASKSGVSQLDAVKKSNNDGLNIL